MSEVAGPAPARRLAIAGLAVGALLGQAGGLVAPGSAQNLLWAVSSVGLVVACAVLFSRELRAGHDVVAVGFLLLAVAECLIWTGGTPAAPGYRAAFAAGVIFYVPALAAIHAPPRLPRLLRALGLASAGVWAIYAVLHLRGGSPAPDGLLAIAGYVGLTASVVGWMIWLARSPRERAA